MYYKSNICMILVFIIFFSAFCQGKEKYSFMESTQSPSVVFNEESFFTNNKTGIFQETSFLEQKDGMEIGKEEEGSLYAPPPNIDENSTPQKMLPLKFSKEILLYIFFLSLLYITLRKGKRKYNLA
ncbi:MAG: hypothetical protein LUG18_03250 [Candidatus Azobacteroides sp.]|nr:hypothetical protein [Candidatus Azobacteroides sp.]